MRTLCYVVKPLFLILVFYPAFAFCAPADFMGMRMDRDFEIKGLTIPVEIASKGQRSLRIYCERVHLESKKVGLFRIGPMPQLVIDNMVVLLPDDTDLATSATALDTFFNASPAWTDAAIRGFKVCQMPENRPLLEAKTARIDAPQGKVFLEKCLTLDNKSEKNHAIAPLCAFEEIVLVGYSLSEAATMRAVNSFHSILFNSHLKRRPFHLMKKKTVFRLVLASLFAALVASSVAQAQTPLSTGRAALSQHTGQSIKSVRNSIVALLIK